MMAQTVSKEEIADYQRMATYLGVNPDNWQYSLPMLKRLSDLEKNEGREALEKEIRKLTNS